MLFWKDRYDFSEIMGYRITVFQTILQNSKVSLCCSRIYNIFVKRRITCHL